ncbi:YdcF family protein [Pseudoxanthomonas sp.]|jgi:Uncharacterized conserved protein|uniref:YdcF family protein n=1 Tax=Pseudoxanthomonas sp. TaxID=1871049 RepID=UPI002FE29017
MTLRRKKTGRGFIGWMWRLLFLALVWLAGVAAYIVWVGQRDDAVPADAIIVLGAAAYDAKPSPVFEERIRHGIDLYKRGLAPTLIFTGGYGGTGARFSESQVARRYAMREGVPAKAILIESLSRNTHDNLRQARVLMQQHKLHTVIIVSDPLHMARALRISRDLGIRSVGSPTPTSRFRSFATRWRFLLQEVYFFHRDRLPR